ncbi:armadillo repeat-containing X-linked protein 1 isoform X2 [Theropithecus gelada]|uniref:armadillo repeat-containing X-linked protein 1 isoform X2 n=1 Tax=Theropithecus gelada TaxID=9565 RepID=UPI00027F6845|nr:armadillo repeat-containing X-linked protein 1 isoform X2 [Theropithecus gelada]
MGVVIGVLISRLTWPSRELEPTRADVLLILVFVWSGCTLSIAQRARGPVAWGKEDEVTAWIPAVGRCAIWEQRNSLPGIPADLGAGGQSNPWSRKIRKVVKNQVKLPQSRPAVAADSARDVFALLWARASLFCAPVKRFVPAIPWAALGKLAAWPLVWLSGLVRATVYTDWPGEETRTRKSGMKTRSLRTPQRLGLRL